MKFKSDIEVQAGLRDGSDDIGTAGQLLSSTGTVTNWIDQAEVVAAGATSVLIACKNTSGGTITKGTPVYQTGNVGATDVITVAEADALISTGYLPAIGLLETDLINNAFGHVVITGELLNITTSPIDGVVPVTGDTIYLKSGGGLTLTKPTGEGNAIQNLGLVGKVSGGNAGSLTVASIMRQNDVPNLPEGRIWIGDGNTIVSDTVYVDEPNNRVGINTATPIYDLDVDGGLRATSWSYFSTDGPTSIAQLGGGTTTTSQFNITSTAAGGSFIAATNTLSIKANNTTAIKIDNAANVGIGTTSPSTTLDVSSSGVNGVDISQSASNATQSGRLFFTTNTASEGFALFNSNGTFQVNSGGIPNNTSGTNRISIIGSSGNVGIGTTSPGSKLTVNGSTRLGGDVEVSELLSGDKVLTLNANTGSFNIGDIDGLGDRAFISGDSSSIEISINQSTSLYCDSNNRVGIGTTSPSQKLDVYGGLHLGTTGDFYITQSSFSTTQFFVTGGGNGGTIFFGAPASNTQNVGVQGDLYSYQGSIGTKLFGSFNNKISYNGDNYLNSGNLGIGTTSPDTKLEVSSSSGGVLRLTSSDTSVATGESIGRVEFKSNDASTGGNNIMGFVDCLATNAGSTYALTFGTGNAAAATEKMRIEPSGNVGMGTTSPYSKLQVASAAGSDVPTAGTATGGLFVSNSNKTYGINMGVSGSGWGFIQSQRADGLTNLYGLNLQPLGGNVGIGTTSPSELLLHVSNGTLRT